MTQLKKTVVVAMSGGVDSSVAAFLLLQQNYHVIGLTMVQKHQLSSSNDAKKICSDLNINHYSINCSQEFQNSVEHYFIQEYLDGRTPNPCVKCNYDIKWGLLLDYAKDLGADFFATGHYARVLYNEQNLRYYLLKAKYKDKDQSYALWKLDQDQLSKTIFPLGTLSKNKVRSLAKQLSLDMAHKTDSQEICFIPDHDYRNYLKKNIKQNTIKPGTIENAEGIELGSHHGYPFYTIGQRRKLGIAVGHPLYVTKIDARNNKIVVGSKNELNADGLVADSLNWIYKSRPAIGSNFETRIRYNDPGYQATIQKYNKNEIEIKFQTPHQAVTPGQSVVFYEKDFIVGGGIIKQMI